MPPSFTSTKKVHRTLCDCHHNVYLLQFLPKIHTLELKKTLFFLLEACLLPVNYYWYDPSFAARRWQNKHRFDTSRDENHPLAAFCHAFRCDMSLPTLTFP